MRRDRSDRFLMDDSASLSQCFFCRHRPAGVVAKICVAFPGAIPEEILFNSYDHRRPWLDPQTGQPGDQGIPLAGSITFAPRPDVPEPILANLHRHLDQQPPNR